MSGLDPNLASVLFLQARRSRASIEVQGEALRRAIHDPSMTLAEIRDASDDVLMCLADLVELAYGVNPAELSYTQFLETMRESAEEMAT